MRTVLILFGTNFVSYNIAAAIDRGLFNPITLLPSNTNKTFKYSDVYYRVLSSKHKWDSEKYLEDLVKTLSFFLKSSKVKTPILFSSDEALNFWIKNSNVLDRYCEVFNQDLAKFYNKELFYNQLKEQAINHPKVYSYSSLTDIHFPVIVKPITKEYENSRLENNQFVKTFGGKIISANNKKELLSILNRYHGSVIIQQKIEFDLGDEYSCWVYANGENLFVYSAQHKNKYPNKEGRISRIGFVDVREVKEIGKEIVSKLDYKGIADIQIVKNKIDSKYYVIEMNPRMWCSHEIFLMNGLNIINKLLCDYYNIDFKFHSEINYNDSTDWYSSIYNLDKKLAEKVKNTELFNIENDNLITRLRVNIFLFLKTLYYKFNK